MVIRFEWKKYITSEVKNRSNKKSGADDKLKILFPRISKADGKLEIEPSEK